MTEISPQIHDSWKEILINEFNADYFKELKNFLVEEKSKFTIYPPGKNIFEAFNRTPFDNIKVVLLGQDPYHGAGQAHGLCFSVQHGIKPPPSLVNIFKELKDDIGMEIPTHGCLESWADQGVLLLNATLTVRANNAGSHQKKGWENFTDAVIKLISDKQKGVVFILWGSYAQKKALLIDNNKHHILSSVHPSPLSVYRGFFGCKHFSKTNEFLIQEGKAPIDWTL